MNIQLCGSYAFYKDTRVNIVFMYQDQPRLSKDKEVIKIKPLFNCSDFNQTKIHLKEVVSLNIAFTAAYTFFL